MEMDFRLAKHAEKLKKALCLDYLLIGAWLLKKLSSAASRCDPGHAAEQR